MKFDNWDNVEGFNGDFETLKVGGYVCKILKVQLEEGKHYGDLLRIAFDIVEGESAGYFKRQFEKKKQSNPETKWQGMLYQTIQNGENLKYFKGFITAIENSNTGYSFKKSNFNEQTLKDKIIGIVFGSEEFEANDGTVKTTIKPRFVRSVEQIRIGNFQVPECKKLAKSNDFSTVPMDDNDELPF